MELTNSAPMLLPGGPRPRWRKVLSGVGAGLAVFVIALLAFLSYIGLFDGNVRTVVPGRVYRSAQLGPERLESLIEEEKLRTVISLRGGDMDDNWFRKEYAACQKEGVDLKVVRLTATSYPKPEELAKLLTLFENVRYPFLMHCRGGADRTGLASTLYLHLHEGLPLAEARKKGLTWHYGHLPFEAKAMDELMDQMQRENPRSVKDWILNRYPTVYAEWRAKRGLKPVAPANKPKSLLDS